MPCAAGWAANRVASPSARAEMPPPAMARGAAGQCGCSRGEPLHAHAVFAGRGEGFPLPDARVCLAVAVTHSPAIDTASVASMVALPVTRAIIPVTSASVPMAETSTT